MRYPTELLPDPLPADPLVLANAWLAESWRQQQQPNPNAMVLATVSAAGQPSARVVLCKEIVPDPGYLLFYTNYRSHKGRELTGNPHAAAVFHWDHLHRQVRVEGQVVQAPAAESDAYFASRPWQSRLGAWASEQSQPVAGRAQLEDALARTAQRFGAPSPDDSASASADVAIPRPPHWGGFRLWVRSVELWVEGAARIHDRARWSRPVTARADGQFEIGAWTYTRLQP
jgi:pyridoxamine 5'-phosphate oxidase